MNGIEEEPIDYRETVDLLIVFADKKTHVVEASIDLAVVGSLVAFQVGEWTHHGAVVERMTCTRDSEAYRCMSRVAEIRKATKIYRCIWPGILAD